MKPKIKDKSRIEKNGGNSGEVKQEEAEAITETLPDEEVTPLAEPVPKIIPWILLRRDGKHSIIITNRDINDYFYPTREDVFIYWTYIKAVNNYVLTRYGGVTPDLEIDDASKKVEGYKKFRPVTVAFLPRDEARAIISGSEFIRLRDTDIEDMVKKIEGYKSVKYKRLLDHVIREWQAERDANMVKIETSFKRGVEVGHKIVKTHLLGVAADIRASVVERVTNKLRSKKVQIPLLIIFMFIMLLLFA